MAKTTLLGGPQKEVTCFNRIRRIFYVRQGTIIKTLLFALICCIISLCCFSYYVSTTHFNTVARNPPEPTIKCRLHNTVHKSNINHTPHNHVSSASLRIDNKVLLLVETQYSKLGQSIIGILEANRIQYKMDIAGKSLPYLTHLDKGKFGVIIFERLKSYTSLDKWNRQLLDKYCREYNVGIIAFSGGEPDVPYVTEVQGFPLKLYNNLAVKDYELNPQSEILRVTRAGEILYGDIPGDDWTVFEPEHATYRPLAYAKTQTAKRFQNITDGYQEHAYTTVIHDTGKYDDINRVLFGNGFQCWVHILLFLDALSFLSHGKFSITLERNILIDIDDIFVGKVGTRMKPADVKALIDSQDRLRRSIPGFHFNLGFSGKYYHRGNDEEDAGDDMLLAYKDAFWWFGHMYSHEQAAKLNQTQLHREMTENVKFAKEKGIKAFTGYAVAPHHSGVYPVHEELYDAWKKVWGVKVTSTEEYPHLRPARYRRGFIHRGIKVLPRQTCGLFTHTIFIDKYPGGRSRLENSIRGGELFQTLLFNPFSVFMTHLSNYGNDRLALYTFESAVKFTQCWTNLDLQSLPPMQFANKYFEMFPEDEDPIWQNPCDDERHLAIWSKNKTCNRLPRFLVIGPQKTGTTALYTFLAMHPAILSNYQSKTTFEEVQFFNGNNYYKGLDWYMEFFPLPPNTTSNFLFEKSANYFDSELAPMRAYALLPQAKLICIIIHPAKRAYSWYQHMRAHGDQTAMTYTFYEVVTAGQDAPRNLQELRERCLKPGLYSTHLERWLEFYKPKQLMILDGEALKGDPVSLMSKVEKFIHIEPRFDYNQSLRYNPKKGFYCQLVQGDRTKCLGRSKGRVYPPMELKAEKFLKLFYRRHLVALSKLLLRLGTTPIPDWLQEELSEFL
ncbi:unnamed protein product [Owenia fusiformis]|uniref:[heparan sulfate]-glucosamine N-sulfotransferase n=1 Tax=Owenia fusiformis TaxID=6347 RepID=A0A8S4PHC2_OWEFU|nr:unnamed protein product [Owenia fusiformis]